MFLLLLERSTGSPLVILKSRKWEEVQCVHRFIHLYIYFRLPVEVRCLCASKAKWFFFLLRLMRRSLLCVHGLIGGVIQQAEQTHHTTAAAFVVDSVWLLRHFIVILHLSVPILFLLLLILHIFVVSFRVFFFFFWSLIVHLNKIPSTSVDTCIRQISGCPPSSRTDGLINWLEELGFLFSEGGWDVSLGLGVVTQRPLVCLIFSTILHLKGGVAK